MIISRQPSLVRIVIEQKQLKNVEYFNYFGSMTVNDVRWTCEIKFKIAMAKVAFNRGRKHFFQQQIGLKFKEETSEVLHLVHSIVRC